MEKEFANFVELIYGLDGSLFYNDKGEQILFTKDEVINLMRRRVNRSHEAFFRRYGVKDLKELDELFGKATEIIEGYPDVDEMI